MIALTKAIKRRHTIRRAGEIRGNEYAITITPLGIELRPFGKRSGTLELSWQLIEHRAGEVAADRIRKERGRALPPAVARRIGRRLGLGALLLLLAGCMGWPTAPAPRVCTAPDTAQLRAIDTTRGPLTIIVQVCR